MPYDYSALTADQAIALLAASDDPLTPPEQIATGRTSSASLDPILGKSSLAQKVRRLLAGDPWLDGEGWVGPVDPKTGGMEQHAKDRLKERFVSRNMIEDITTRHVDGVVGREPAWGFTPERAMKPDEQMTEAEDAQINAIEAKLTAWWDKRRCHALFQKTGAEAILSGRAVLRLYVPVSRLVTVTTPDAAQRSESDGQASGNAAAATGDQSARPAGDVPGEQRGVVAPTIDDALDQIYVEMVNSDNATVYTDTDSMEKIGVVVYYQQGTYPGANVGPRVVELTYLDPATQSGTPQAERRTLIRNIVQGAADTPTPLALGGHITHYAVVRPPIVSTAILSLVKLLNFQLSNLLRVIETSGFMERTLINVQNDAGEYVAGAGTTNNLKGAVVEDPEKGTILMTPDIRYKEPSPVAPIIEAIDATSAEILREAKQAHVLGSDQVQSGISRVQARADFEKSLGRTQAALEPAGRWLLETALRMAVLFATEKEGIDPEQFRARFTCFTDTGPLDPQEKTTITAAVQQGILSKEWGQQALGVEDVDAENAVLNSEPSAISLRETQRAAAVKGYTDQGMTLLAAAKITGLFDAKELALIEQDQLDNPPPPQPVPGGLLDAQGNPLSIAPTQATTTDNAQPPQLAAANAGTTQTAPNAAEAQNVQVAA